MTCYLINRSRRAALEGKVADEVWTCNEVDYSRLRLFGCQAYAHIVGEEILNLDAKSTQCIFYDIRKGQKTSSCGIQR